MNRAHLLTAILISTVLTGCFKRYDRDRQYQSEELPFSLVLSEDAPIVGFSISTTASDGALYEEDANWSLDAYGHLINTSSASAEISLWQLDAPWDGSPLPEDAFPLSEDTLRGVIDEDQVKEMVNLDGSFDPEAPLHFAFALEGGADISGELDLYVTVYLFDEDAPNQDEVTVTMSIE